MAILCGVTLIAASVYQFVAIITGDRTNQRLPRIYCVESFFPNQIGRKIDLATGIGFMLLGIALLVGLFPEGNGSMMPFRNGRNWFR